MRHRYILAFIVLVSAASVAWIGIGSAATERAAFDMRKFDIGLIGDTRYTPEQQAKFPNLIEEMNQENLAFIVHDGDIKAGSNPCANAIYTETVNLFNQFSAPFIYTPGDNEWTDCHRAGGDPLERLGFLRQTFYPTNESLGQDTMTLQRQSAQYPENARWTFGAATFATLHIVGSNNNKPVGTPPVGNQAEYDARNAANLAWLRRRSTRRKTMEALVSCSSFKRTCGTPYQRSSLLASPTHSQRWNRKPSPTGSP